MTKLVASALILASALSFSLPVYAQNLNNTAALYAHQDQAQNILAQKERSMSSSNKD